MAEYSPTGNAGAAADVLDELLVEEGFDVQRVEAGHPKAPAVVVRFESGEPGPCLQFDGHLDTVPIGFVPPAMDAHQITGSGAADMKGGIASAVEALLALRDSNTLQSGSVLLTAHELHECPWGDGHQLEGLIEAGFVGDGVLIPEYFNECLPLAGRGGLIWAAEIKRPGSPIHEVNRPDEPSVIAVAADLIQKLKAVDQTLQLIQHPVAGRESLFVGRIESGRIYNEFPQTCRLEGTRRWIPGTSQDEVCDQLRDLVDQCAAKWDVAIDLKLTLMRDAFQMDLPNSLVTAFQKSYTSISGAELTLGAKPFVDDGNVFSSLAGIPAITHGPLSGGAHTLEEWSSIDDLVRVATLYAMTALEFCGPST